MQRSRLQDLTLITSRPSTTQGENENLSKMNKLEIMTLLILSLVCAALTSLYIGWMWLRHRRRRAEDDLMELGQRQRRQEQQGDGARQGDDRQVSAGQTTAVPTYFV